MKLPNIHLPTFDGTFENWSAFYEIFSSTIDRNDQLTPIQKLRYLQASVNSRAARYVQSSKSTKVSYTDIIAALKERFDCPRQICLRHFSAMQQYPKLTKETPETLANLIGTMKQHLRALKNLGNPVTSNTIIIGLFLSKIHPDTIQQWKLTIPNEKMPSYTHLLDSLEKQANCVITTSVATPARTTRASPTRQSTEERIHSYALSVSNLPRIARNLDLRHLQGEISQGTSYSHQKNFRVHQLPDKGALDYLLYFRILSCVRTSSPHASASGRN